jgi:gas vesicle protein
MIVEGSMAERDNSDIVLAVLLGGLIGAAIGMLYAPRSGKETRRRLRELSEDISETLDDVKKDVIDRAEEAVAEVKERIVEQKERINSVIDAGKKAFEKK